MNHLPLWLYVQNVGIIVLLCVMHFLFISTIEGKQQSIYFIEKLDAPVVKMSWKIAQFFCILSEKTHKL